MTFLTAELMNSLIQHLIFTQKQRHDFTSELNFVRIQTFCLLLYEICNRLTQSDDIIYSEN